MRYSKVVIGGGGVLGSQIAFQTAFCGFDVTIWLRSESSITRTQPKLDQLKETYLEAIEKMASGEGPWCAGIAAEENFKKEELIAKVNRAYESIQLELDLKKAVGDADLVIESMAENTNDKIVFYKALAPLLPEKRSLLRILPHYFLPLLRNIQEDLKSIYRFILRIQSGRIIRRKLWLKIRQTRNTLMN